VRRLDPSVVGCPRLWLMLGHELLKQLLTSLAVAFAMRHRDVPTEGGAVPIVSPGLTVVGGHLWV
jgi:hypothetical protein